MQILLIILLIVVVNLLTIGLMKRHYDREEEQIQQDKISYSRLMALAGDYILIYIVDPDTGHFTEYNAVDGKTDMETAKKGDDFFGALLEEAAIMVAPEDKHRFLTHLTKENVLKGIEESGAFVLQYQILMRGNKLTYVTLKAAMLHEKEGDMLIYGIINIDSQVRREIEYAQTLAAAQQQAKRDGLTGVKNKLAWIEAKEEIDRQIGDGSVEPFAIVMFDVNNLKRVNDEEGHQAGDALIKEACSLICHTFKHSPVFRIGGDEFTVLVKGRDYEALPGLCCAVEEQNRENTKTGGIVVAYGAAKYEGEPEINDVFKRADANMYENKHHLKACES